MRTSLIFLVVLSVAQALPRSKRQNCDCTPGEAPKCGCQVMPTPETGGGQMICTCSPPVPPKCVCTEGNVNCGTMLRNPGSCSGASYWPIETTESSKNIITGSSLPALFKPYSCVSTCESSCLDSCNRLNFNTKCASVCNEACQFTCAKQELQTTLPTTTQAPVTTVMLPLPPHIQEYRFVIPAGNLVAKTVSTTTTTPRPLVISQKIQITCPSECQPSCSFVCTKLRPTLKVITQMFDSKTDEGTCRTSCSSACLSVCASSGVAGNECQSNCAPACEDTCTIVKPVAVATTQVNVQPTSASGAQCVSVCMPACTPQCMFTVQMQIALAQATSQPATTEKPAQAVLIPIAPVSLIVPETTTTQAPVTLGTICRNECLVQCEHQCSPTNPNCMAACQTTCYPVCQSKLRRRMKEIKTERDFALHH